VALRLPLGYELYGLLRMLGRFAQAQVPQGRGACTATRSWRLEPMLTDSA
jgi:membrane protein